MAQSLPVLPTLTDRLLRSQSGENWRRTSTLRSRSRRSCGSFQGCRALRRKSKPSATGRKTASSTPTAPTGSALKALQARSLTSRLRVRYGRCSLSRCWLQDSESRSVAPNELMVGCRLSGTERLSRRVHRLLPAPDAASADDAPSVPRPNTSSCRILRRELRSPSRSAAGRRRVAPNTA